MKKKIIICLAACSIFIGGCSFYGTSSLDNEPITIEIEETEQVPTSEQQIPQIR